MHAAHKELVERLVAEVMNGQDLDVLDEICTPRLARGLRQAYTEFRASFPDWHQEIIELVADGETVVGRFRCSGTQVGEWLGMPATGRSMRIDEVYFFRLADGRLDRMWGLEDTWTRLGQLFGVERAGELARAGAPQLDPSSSPTPAPPPPT
jgi:predicted ester cyclase